MSEQNNDSLYQKQKAVRPKPEDVVAEILDENKLESLLDFLDFLKDNKLTPRWGSSNSWAIKYKKETVCHIKIVRKSWYIMFSLATREKWFVGYDKYFADDELKEFVWENVKKAWCPKGCKRGGIMILGKEFNDICSCWAIRVINPDGVALKQSKRVILTIKELIADLEAAGKT